MTIHNKALLKVLNDLLQPEKIHDYCPNGLQVEGKTHISKVITGVTASQALIEAAVRKNADAILVHHGYFWKGENPCIIGMKRQRLQLLLTNQINLFAYHLPLDIHPNVGNNAQLAEKLGIVVKEGLEVGNPRSIAMQGYFAEPIAVEELTQRITAQLQRPPLVESTSDKPIRTVAWCTGGGQNYIELAAEQGIDAFITGEASEQTIHTAREMGIHFFAAGHHATERYGVRALGELLATEHGINVEFVDIDNPV